MATADKLTYLNETKNEIRKAIEEENLVTIDDTTTFREYADKIKSTNEEIKKYIPTDSQSGTSLQVTNAVPLNTKELVIDGNSYQYTTKGNQLVDFSNNKSISTNTTFSFEDDVLSVSATTGGYKRVEYDILELIKNNPNKILYFDYESVDFSNGNNPLVQITYILDGTKKYFTLLNQANQRGKYTIPEDSSNITSSLLEVYCNNTNTSVEASISITKPMLQFGTDKLEYEQYTGGIASPSPDYSQNIEVVSGKNIIGLGTPIDGYTGITNSGKWINSTSGKTYYFETSKLPDEVIISGDGNRSNVSYFNSIPTTNGQIADKYETTNYQYMPRSFKVDKNYKYIFIQVYYDAYGVGELNLQLEKGNIATEIIPFNNLRLTNSGKNICPTDYEKYWEKGHYNVNGVKTTYQSRCRLVNLLKIKPNTKYYCNLSETSYQFTIREFDINGVFLKDKGLIGQSAHLYTSSSDAYFIGLSIAFDNTSDDVDYSSLLGDIKPFICLYSETNKEFELYRETDEYLIDLKDNFIAKINDVKDTLDLTSGVLSKNVKKVVLDGSEDEKWNMDALQTGCSLRSFYTNIAKEEVKPYSTPLANYLSYNNDLYFNDNIGIDANWNGAIRIKIGANVSTLDELVNYLSNNPLVVYYQLAETKIIQLDPITIKMHEGTNNIELDTNLETNMSLDYYKDYRIEETIEEVSEE